ncbi:hypothetical protein HDU87_008744 [Geranomyces variabilis]|uniref:Tubulin-specific chaperone D n=1 Tax=Geranomyces variabilis TaxID=109894 RepID=A0AAD5XIW2_9FUNG|nr:hypothetical protein HDU87_008744 [Geranomyces variabilis]
MTREIMLAAAQRDHEDSVAAGSTGEKEAAAAAAADPNDCGPPSFFAHADLFATLLASLAPDLDKLQAQLEGQRTIGKEGRSEDAPAVVDGGGVMMDHNVDPATADAKTCAQDRQFAQARELLDAYQEQPWLLDAHLEQLVQPTMARLQVLMSLLYEVGDAVLTARCVRETFRPLLGLLYHLSKVRGHKTVIKFFPHEVADLEPVLFVLESVTTMNKAGGTVPRASSDSQLWEGRYVLLLWLSLLSMVPFDLKTVDSGTETGGDPLVDRIMALAKHYLSSVSKEYEGAALLLMRLATRKDAAVTHLPDLVSWAAQEAISSVANGDVFRQRGFLLALSTICKGARRELLLPVIDKVLPCCALVDEPLVQHNALLRKLLVKLAQRAGLVYLKPRAAKWRYDRGNRSLERNLAGTATVSLTPAQGSNHIADSCADDDDEEDFDVPEELDSVVEILLNGLRDRDTIIRWSAAKGIGRIVNRLPHNLGQDIVLSIVALLEEDVLVAPDGKGHDLSQVSDSTWHGSCLALAELARRGLLLPDRLGDVVPWILLALKFDQRRGAHSIGSHVRDAACYVCWSFARAYAPEIIAPFVSDLASALVVVSLCDREVNIRRAASAAFQENVGRQGLFPHGIDIVTAADYFAVGNRTAAFLDIAVGVARYPEYHSQICQHVATISLVHWDPTMRVLAADALANLTPIDLAYMSREVLPTLIVQAGSEELNVRHGAALAIGEICLALQKSAATAGGATPWGEGDTMTKVVLPISKIIETYPPRHLDGFGGDQTRFAVCRLITRLAQAFWPATGDFRSAAWQLAIRALSQRDEKVQTAGAAAVAALNSWHVRETRGIDAAMLEEMLDGVKVLPNADRFKRRGCAMALGGLTGDVLVRSGQRIFAALMDAAMVQTDLSSSLNDAESRRNAVQALASLATHLSRERQSRTEHRDLLRAVMPRLRATLFAGLADYCTDSRGDVGSWVRQACMHAFRDLARLENDNGDGDCEVIAVAMSEDERVRLAGELCKQAVEKIDRMREVAGAVLMEVLWEVDGFEFEGREELRALLPRNAELNWSSSTQVYTFMMPVLAMPQFRAPLLEGLVVSIGGLSESLVRHSSAAFIAYINSLPALPPAQPPPQQPQPQQQLQQSPPPPLTIHAILTTLCDNILATHTRIDRVSIPTLETLDLMFGCGAVRRARDAVLWARALTLVQAEVFRSRDVKKLLAGAKVFCGFVVGLGREGENDDGDGGGGGGVEQAVVEVRRKALAQLVGYLAHPYPKVRRAVAELLYLALTSEENDDVDDEGMDEEESAQDILLATDWDLPATQLKDTRDRLKALLSP